VANLSVTRLSYLKEFLSQIYTLSPLVRLKPSLCSLDGYVKDLGVLKSPFSDQVVYSESF